jgi:hypothetical protein
MGILKRAWPFAFLIAFVLLLTFHGTPPSRGSGPRESRTAAEEDATPEAAGRCAPPRTPSPLPASDAGASEAEEETQPRSTSSVLAGLLWALKNQNDDGSWGDEPTTLGDRTIGKIGVTSLILLSLSGAGYSQLSKDEYDDVVVGPRIKKALHWLLSQQREDGLFRSGHDESFDQALAAYALSELYGMTASQPLKEPTALALDALVRLQRADGSWGGKEPTQWAADALISGQYSELPYPPETRERMLAWFHAHPSPTQLDTRVLLKDHPEALESLAQGVVCDLPRAGETDFGSIYRGSSGLYLYDGSEGALWKQWVEPMRRALLPSQNRDGSWNGGSLSHCLVRSSLATLSLETFYRYSSVFRLGK